MNEYVIAKYIRLSIDDGITESLSIPNQRLLLDRYIEQLDIPNVTVLEFVDNGYSGTNMDRPQLQAMLNLVQYGGINCIISKDFSRFSRNALESGYYIEQVFPIYQVRFVSVGDNFDSDDYKDKTGGLDVAFKFLMHEHYSMDLSKKVKSAKRIKMKSGKNIVANAIYGYRKNDMGKWEPDPDAALIVQTIFGLTLEGLCTAEIRDKLSAAKYPTPKEYIDIKHGKTLNPKCVWTARMILHILQNEQYAGSYISGKQEPKAIGSHSKINTDKSEWIIIPDSHPPIVSREDFTKALEVIERQKNARTQKPKKNLLQDDENRPHRSSMISGERLANNTIYGYIKDESGKLKVDRSAAKVICKMYEMAVNGLSIKDIQIELTTAGYPIPIEHIQLNKGFDITPKCQWTAKSIRGILQNIQYTGAYVSGKILKDYQTGKKYHTAQSDWIVIPDINPVIVDKELFDKVQEIFSSNKVKRRNMRPRDYLLRGGIVKCGCCGYAMMYDDSARNIVYRCNHTLSEKSADCHKFKLSALELDETILTLIRKQAEIILNSNDISNYRKKNESAKNTIEIEKQINVCRNERKKLYERFYNQEIEREEYLSLKNDCTSRIEMLHSRLTVLRQAENVERAKKKTIDIAKMTLSETGKSREIVEALIEKVMVFPGMNVEVVWKIADFALGM